MSPTVKAGRREVPVSSPDRVVFDGAGLTKLDLARYYADVADAMVPHVRDRPLALHTFPKGVSGEGYFAKNEPRHFPDWIATVDVPKREGGTIRQVLANDAPTLVYLAGQNAIALHVWTSRADRLERPDRLIFDLDPAPDVPFEAVKRAAQDLRRRLKRKGLESMLKCTGGKGLHVTVPLASKEKWPEVKSFAAVVANEMVETAPETYVATMTKTKRKGKIFVDYFRNDYTATAIADYAVRARPGAPVALPLEWKELRTLKSASQFTMKDVLKRLARKGPPAPSAQGGHRIPSA